MPEPPPPGDELKHPPGDELKPPPADEPRAASADALRAIFDRASEFTVGIEEELLLLHPETLEPMPRAAEVLGWLGADARFKLELQAAQIEIKTAPCATAGDAAAELMAARRELAACDGRVLFAGAGVSPLGSGTGLLSKLPRYERTIRDYDPVIRWQQVCALQVHVAVPGADRALAVYNQARSYLPWFAALSANGAFYQGTDTGLASIRPKIANLLPRHGIPPALASWREYADALGWVGGAGAIAQPGTWWWDLRPHPAFGTLEFRVPDTQSTVAESAALAAMIHALVVWLARRYDSGEPLPIVASWRLEENHWSACRYGVEGAMIDAHTGEPRSTRQCLDQLLDELAGVGAELGASAALERGAQMVQLNGAIRQRRAASRGGAREVARCLVERFLEPWPG